VLVQVEADDGVAHEITVLGLHHVLFSLHSLLVCHVLIELVFFQEIVPRCLVIPTDLLIIMLVIPSELLQFGQVLKAILPNERTHLRQEGCNRILAVTGAAEEEVVREEVVLHYLLYFLGISCRLNISPAFAYVFKPLWNSHLEHVSFPMGVVAVPVELCYGHRLDQGVEGFNVLHLVTIPILVLNF